MSAVVPSVALTRHAVQCPVPEPLISMVPLHRKWTLWNSVIIIVSVTANGALLIGQHVAIRLLSPLIGSSVETWSMIIGVFLLGIALGNRIAGKLTDRMPAAVLIASGLLLGAVSLAGMPILCDVLSQSEMFAGMSLNLQIISASLIVCLLPGISLSLITPPSIRSVITHADESGSASGRIFAWGTFGSLAGNYLAGFLLLAWFGVRLIVGLTSLSLPTVRRVRWVRILA